MGEGVNWRFDALTLEIGDLRRHVARLCYFVEANTPIRGGGDGGDGSGGGGGSGGGANSNRRSAGARVDGGGGRMALSPSLYTEDSGYEDVWWGGGEGGGGGVGDAVSRGAPQGVSGGMSGGGPGGLSGGQRQRLPSTGRAERSAASGPVRSGGGAERGRDRDREREHRRRRRDPTPPPGNLVRPDSAIDSAIDWVGRCRLTPDSLRVHRTLCQRLKLEYDTPLSTFALNFNLCRYNWENSEHLHDMLGQDQGRGLHLYTFQLNLSTFYGIGVARRGCVARVKGVLGGV